MKQAIAYYRVSTDRQGKSGLGLEAQQDAVRRFIEQEGFQLVAHFTEIESGKNNQRPELAAALAQCRKHKATLVIAKLDRLSRNLAFIANLIESKVDFKAVDNPYANKPMMQMLAVFAEHERDQISIRTKDALQAAKRRGVQLGKTGKIVGRQNSEAVASFAEQLRPTIEELRSEGFITLRAIRDELNRRRVPTYRPGAKWHVETVSRVLKRVKNTILGV